MSMQAKGLATEDTEGTEKTRTRKACFFSCAIAFSVISVSSVAKRFSS